MNLSNLEKNQNVIAVPGVHLPKMEPSIPTPKSDKIFAQAERLKALSSYPCRFNFDVYKDLELRFGLEQPRGGITFNTPFKLVNSHTTCQQCLYAFEVDTYGRGCIHDCVYCYAKDQLTSHGYWNRPMPMPADISEIWKVFYTVFETDKKSKWREVMEKRIPIRIGSMSDSFMFMDKKYKVTQEFLRILDYYKYPYIIFTRSDLVADDKYIELLNSNLCSVQLSISSTNDEMNKLIEPGAPSARRRLKAIEKLTKSGFWTTVRLNPFFPMYPDGYFSNPDFDRKNNKLEFHYSSFDMVSEIADAGAQSLLAGIVRLSPYAINQIGSAAGVDLKPFFGEKTKSTKDYHYSRAEVRAYYDRIHARCKQRGIQFTTCYIGNGEEDFWNDQDLWDNKKDCCNAKGRVQAVKSSSRDLSWNTRLKYTSHKCATPNDAKNLRKDL